MFIGTFSQKTRFCRKRGLTNNYDALRMHCHWHCTTTALIIVPARAIATHIVIQDHHRRNHITVTGTSVAKRSSGSSSGRGSSSSIEITMEIGNRIPLGNRSNAAPMMKPVGKVPAPPLLLSTAPATIRP
jgi:hypothetical protein